VYQHSDSAVLHAPRYRYRYSCTGTGTGTSRYNAEFIGTIVSYLAYHFV
jgi:hypothetical protein